MWIPVAPKGPTTTEAMFRMRTPFRDLGEAMMLLKELCRIVRFIISGPGYFPRASVGWYALSEAKR